MEPNQQNIQDSDDQMLKSLFNDLRLDDLSKDFEREFTRLEHAKRVDLWKRYGFGALGITCISLLTFFALNQQTDKDAQDFTKRVQMNAPTGQEGVNNEYTRHSNNSKPSKIAYSNNNDRVDSTVVDDSKNTSTNSDPQSIQSDPSTFSNVLSSTSPKQVSTVSEPSKNTSIAPTSSKQSQPCDGVVIHADTKSNPSCVGKETGEIQVFNLKNGEAPYQVSVHKTHSFSEKKKINYLAPGQYSVFAKDNNGCISKVSIVEVGEEECIDDRDLIYSISRQNEIRIPIKRGDQMVIMNKRGSVVARYVSQGDSFLFNGLSDSGEPLDTGLYILMVTSNDGRISKNEITVVP